MRYADGPDLTALQQRYTTAEYACSYFPERRARSEVVMPTHLMTPEAYGQLVQQGFRRSGVFTYRPACAACQACIPYRVDAQNFCPSRSQKRVYKRHSQLQVQLLPLQWYAEHYELYDQYQSIRHPGAGMDENTATQYREFLLSSQVDSCLVEFRDAQDVVRMVAVMDRVDNGLSAVYTFFDPNYPGSLGTYAILWQVKACQQLNLDWLYLGYWIEKHQKMSYKSSFRPAEIYRQGKWQRLP